MKAYGARNGLPVTIPDASEAVTAPRDSPFLRVPHPAALRRSAGLLGSPTWGQHGPETEFAVPVGRVIAEAVR